VPERKEFDLGDYIEVKDRIAKFYELFGQGRLVTGEVRLTTEPDGVPRVLVQALAYRSPEDAHPGVGWSWMALPGTTPYTKGSELENTETSAWGRAIAATGILIDRSIASANEIRGKAPVETDPMAPEVTPVGPWSTRGTAEPAGAPFDGLLRQTPTGGAFGFAVVADDGKRFYALAEGPLALPISLVWEAVQGQEVHVTGHASMVRRKRREGGKIVLMRGIRQIEAERIESGEIVIPAPPDGPLRRIEEEEAAQAEAFTEAMSVLGADDEAELDAIAKGLGAVKENA